MTRAFYTLSRILSPSALFSALLEPYIWFERLDRPLMTLFLPEPMRSVGMLVRAKLND